MVTNMKIVHESEVRKLKGVIEELRKELEKGIRGSEVGSLGGSRRT